MPIKVYLLQSGSLLLSFCDPNEKQTNKQIHCFQGLSDADCCCELKVCLVSLSAFAQVFVFWLSLDQNVKLASHKPA